MNTINAGIIAAEERARVSALLARYPDLSEAELADIRNWFDRVASSLDVGLLAADPQVAVQYRAWRTEHYDRFEAKDWLKGALFAAGAAAFLGAIILLMPA